jgi:hypothetical protein
VLPSALAEAPSLARLKATAIGPDTAAANSALAELSSDNLTKPAAADIAQELLPRDAAAIEKAAAGIDEEKLAKALEEMETFRAKAFDNISNIAKGTPIRNLHVIYDRLSELQSDVRSAQSRRCIALDLMSRRPELRRILREVRKIEPVKTDEDSDAKLHELADKALGMPLDQAQTLPLLGEGNRPDDRPLWFYRVCRQVEAYNAKQAEDLGKEEFATVRWTNQYREALGLLPLEIDARLTQAARRHSKEMFDLKYFGHGSKTPSENQPQDRLAHAGYKTQAWKENVAMGHPSGETVFWAWFDSPGHHKQMTSETNAIGVGRWGDYWTEDFGGEPRLMGASAADRAAARIEGDLLPPQGKVARASRP